NCQSPRCLARRCRLASRRGRQCRRFEQHRGRRSCGRLRRRATLRRHQCPAHCGQRPHNQPRRFCPQLHSSHRHCTARRHRHRPRCGQERRIRRRRSCRRRHCCCCPSCSRRHRRPSHSPRTGRCHPVRQKSGCHRRRSGSARLRARQGRSRPGICHRCRRFQTIRFPTAPHCPLQRQSRRRCHRLPSKSFPSGRPTAGRRHE